MGEEVMAFKIRLWCGSGANAFSERKDIIDLEKDWNMTREEWNAMTDDDKQKVAEDWALERLDIGYSEVEEGEDE